ncbi:hypothetical protein [Paracoccus sp. (in: a-proteobacteria)]|uniref:hypothetical protein n=1 Tax=Paracoccus sp. TaxID=267 RepID=UPI00396C889C
MAREFLTGTLHGGLLGVAALAGLSLLLPVGQEVSHPVAVAPAPVVPQAAPAERPAMPAGPEAGSVGLPVGSEFGRGGDLAPRLPEPANAAPRPGSEGPAAVPAPAAESAPAAMAGDTARPELLVEDRMTAPSEPEAGEDAPGLALPDASAAAPAARDVPQAPAALAPDAGQDALPEVAPEPASDVPAAPSLPAPGLDLSLPPDLTDLRQLERN